MESLDQLVSSMQFLYKVRIRAVNTNKYGAVGKIDEELRIDSTKWYVQYKDSYHAKNLIRRAKGLLRDPDVSWED